MDDRERSDLLRMCHEPGILPSRRLAEGLRELMAENDRLRIELAEATDCLAALAAIRGRAEAIRNLLAAPAEAPPPP